MYKRNRNRHFFTRYAVNNNALGLKNITQTTYSPICNGRCCFVWKMYHAKFASSLLCGELFYVFFTENLKGFDKSSWDYLLVWFLGSHSNKIVSEIAKIYFFC